MRLVHHRNNSAINIYTKTSQATQIQKENTITLTWTIIASQSPKQSQIVKILMIEFSSQKIGKSKRTLSPAGVQQLCTNTLINRDKKTPMLNLCCHHGLIAIFPWLLLSDLPMGVNTLAINKDSLTTNLRKQICQRHWLFPTDIANSKHNLTIFCKNMFKQRDDTKPML